jgi:hypothetical protein
MFDTSSCYGDCCTGELCEFYKAEDLSKFPVIAEAGVTATVLDYGMNATASVTAPATIQIPSSSSSHGVKSTMSSSSQQFGSASLQPTQMSNDPCSMSLSQYMQRPDWVRYRLLFNPHETPVEDALVSEYVSRWRTNGFSNTKPHLICLFFVQIETDSDR